MAIHNPHNMPEFGKKGPPRKSRKKLILKQPIKEGLKTIKVRCNDRTVIEIANMKAFPMWKARYPNAEVITH